MHIFPDYLTKWQIQATEHIPKIPDFRKLKEQEKDKAKSTGNIHSACFGSKSKEQRSNESNSLPCGNPS